MNFKVGDNKDVIKEIKVEEPFKIKKGDIFQCIKDVVMNDGVIDYKKGSFYTSDCDGCITDEQYTQGHYWTGDDNPSEYFIKVDSINDSNDDKYNDNVSPSGVECIDKNVQSFKNIANELCDLYEKKNKAYGNSFGDTYKKLGIISAVTRISDKYNRLCNLATNPNIDNLGESIEDTLKDLAAYSIMTLNELRNRKEE